MNFEFSWARGLYSDFHSQIATVLDHPLVPKRLETRLDICQVKDSVRNELHTNDKDQYSVLFMCKGEIGVRMNMQTLGERSERSRRTPSGWCQTHCALDKGRKWSWLLET